MTPRPKSASHWRRAAANNAARATAAEKTLRDFEAFGVVHPSEVLRLKRRVAELEAQCLKNSESRSIA